MRGSVHKTAHFNSSSSTKSRICSFKQRNAQTSKNPSLPTMTLPTVLPKLIAFDLVRIFPISIQIDRLVKKNLATRPPACLLFSSFYITKPI